MLNYIWSGIMLVAIIVSFFNNTVESVSSAVMSGAMDGVKLVIELTGIMCFWTGLMSVAEKSGMIRIISVILRPVTRFLFPDIDKNSPAHNAIVMNMSANLLGMSNAATPLGLCAMRELSLLNHNRKRASNAMCMFVIINTASIQILPSTIIALRAASGSAAPSEITVPIWIVSASALLVAVLSAKLFEKRS